MVSKANETVTGPLGFRAGAVRAGIKQSGELDLGLLVADIPCAAAGVFTSNKVVGPAVVTSRRHIRNGRAQVVYVNAGNANTCTGKRGERDVQTICRIAAGCTGVKVEDVLVCSTGIIGEPLAMDKVRQGISRAAAGLKRTIGAGRNLARAIMTTDTKMKLASRTFPLQRHEVQISGIAKGSGMIAPNMATMLAFITTDAAIKPALLKQALKSAVDITFNKVTIDNHMSTSDSVIVLASGMANNDIISAVGKSYDKFAGGLWEVCDSLARQMAADGEGAGRMITVRVQGAASGKDGRLAVRAICDSPLVRTAFNGADPNWGRIVSALGYSGAHFDVNNVTCRIAGTCVFRNGQPRKFDRKSLSKKMKGKAWEVVVELGAGEFSDFCYTCDLSREYVAINADYHT